MRQTRIRAAVTRTPQVIISSLLSVLSAEYGEIAMLIYENEVPAVPGQKLFWQYMVVQWLIRVACPDSESDKGWEPVKVKRASPGGAISACLSSKSEFGNRASKP